MKKLLSILLTFTLVFPFTMSADNVTIRIKAMRCEGCAHKVGKALKNQKVDTVTGATFTSDAMRKTIELGLDYYKKHK